MKDVRHWQPFVRKLFHSRPRRLVFLTPSPKRFVPECEDAVAKRANGRPVRWNGMIREKACDDLFQPVSLLWDWLMSLAQQFLLNCLEFRAHAVASGFPLEEEPAPAQFFRRST